MRKSPLFATLAILSLSSPLAATPAAPVLSGTYLLQMTTTCPPTARWLIPGPVPPSVPVTSWIDTFSGTAVFHSATRTLVLSGTDEIANFIVTDGGATTTENTATRDWAYYNDANTLSIGTTVYHATYGASVNGIASGLAFSGLSLNQCTVAGRISR